MREIKVWRGKYREINYEINNFKLSENDSWTFYLYIPLNILPKEKRELFWLKPQRYKLSTSYWIGYDYMQSNIINRIDWHCGCTFYEKHGGFDGHKKAVKIGCDYQHYWDEGCFYDLDIVLQDTKNAIDSLWRIIPDIKLRCGYCGKLGRKNYIQRKEDYVCINCAKKHYPELLTTQTTKKGEL